MPESKQISTLTDLNVSGNNISIFTYYQEDELPNTLAAAIGDEDNTQDGTPYITGEAIIKMKNYPDQIDYIIDDDGNLILINQTDDEDKYDIDEDSGDLIYTY